jgi:site-specific DNA-adenine methylase
MNDQEHIELLETLLKHPGKVLISGYDNDLYNFHLSGWEKALTELPHNLTEKLKQFLVYGLIEPLICA